MQGEMARRNSEVPKDRRIEFRIGINLGDVMVEDSDIFGDGVNVAARLETLAGRKASASAASCGPGPRQARRQLRGYGRTAGRYRLAGARLSRLAADDARPNPPQAAAPDQSPTSRFAVLPFKNVTGDPEQSYFVDGMTEDIITALSKWRWFRSSPAIRPSPTRAGPST